MHFGVLVKIKDPADLDDVMAPFDENKEEEPYIVETKQQAIDRVREDADEKLKTYADYYKDPEAYKIANPNNSQIIQMLEERKYEDIAKMTDEEIYNKVVKEIYDESEFDDDGNIVSTYNPESHWDWWVIGGRWGNSLISKDLTEINDGRCDYCKFKDLDLAKMMEVTPRELAVAEARWDNSVEGVPIPEEFKDDIVINSRKEYYLNRYGTKENYLQSLATVSFYACIDENGVWHEQEHSKLDVSSDEYYEEDNRLEEEWHDNFVRDYLLGTDPETYVVVVDCHI